MSLNSDQIKKVMRYSVYKDLLTMEIPHRIAFDLMTDLVGAVREYIGMTSHNLGFTVDIIHNIIYRRESIELAFIDGNGDVIVRASNVDIPVLSTCFMVT